MLTICLRILSLLGIILLILLLVALTLLFLALFVPVTYRISGTMDGKPALSVKVKWLLGLLGIGYRYPEPGYLSVKLLCFPVYKVKIPPDGAEGAAHGSPGPKAPGESPSPPERGKESGRNEEAEEAGGEDSGTDTAARSADAAASGSSPSGSGPSAGEAEGTVPREETSLPGFPGKILKILEKIKFTICGIYDKIKKIWNNISYYMELLQEEETRQLFSHGRRRLGNVLKSIRPRHIRARILFGTGAPDTTGYLYGIYCMVLPNLGNGVCVTPDFQEKVLQGEFDLSGRITLWVLLWNVLKVLLDSRLRKLIRKAKAPD